MTRTSVGFGAVLGGILVIPLMALLFLGERFAQLPFVPFDLFDWMARVLPGDLITFGIDTLVSVTLALGFSTSDTAKLAEQALALVMFVGIGVVLGGVVALLARRMDQPASRIGAFVGLALFLFFAVVETGLSNTNSGVAALIWLLVLTGGWGWLLGTLLPASAAATDAAEAEAGTRRDVLVKVAGGSVAVALAAWGLGRMLARPEQATGAGQPLTNLQASTATPEPNPTGTATSAPTATAPADSSAAATATPGEAGAAEEATATATNTAASEPPPEPTATATMRDRVEPAPGTRPELTSNEDFYRIDINTRPVTIDGSSWVLEVEGLFDNARPLTLQDIMQYPTVTQPLTLSCISNRIGGDLIGTSNWTGARLRDVVKDLGMRPEAQELFIEAEDGFYESVVMEDIMDPRTLLVYGMNGETLPVEHGFPLRIYIPNRYGMKQPKWITRIEAIDQHGAGYWVDRGWSEEARPHIISVIDTVATGNIVDGNVPIGGIAWAGDRGIQKVEVQVDGGEWNEAILRTPPLSGLTWVQWRYDWPAEGGTHEFRVRATDGTGMLQIEERSGPRPDGSTGYHSVQASV